ncbi:hypothetical protein BGZ61DRAFT_442343, partial [Ilyonectria robusta]|uniref:uncharacterized protein n=1 Tax=Ilyonectria robusta TaxID=1079257 RepID=UPI001E8ED66D
MAQHRKLSVRKLDLLPPPLKELELAIHNGLKQNFSKYSVQISTSPDLREAPFYLAGPGLSGDVRIADVGGQANLRPSPNFDSKYDLLAISELMDMSQDGGVLIGAGAGPFHVLGRNTELMPNIAYGSATADGKLHNCTRYAKVTDDGTVCCERIEPTESTGFGLMCNLLGCNGESGPMLHIKAKGRLQKANFPESIQNAIREAYGEKLISLGGVFVIHTGKTKLHVMPDFPGKPFDDEKDVGSWLKFFDTDAPLVCLSVFHSGNQQDWGLRTEHTHCFAVDGQDADKRGGHYHHDLDETMEEVEYEGWFSVADVLYRIDQPV